MKLTKRQRRKQRKKQKLFDQFAGRAMQALIECCETWDRAAIATEAYELAEKMLIKRKGWELP